jgi:hypothetical protein
MRGIDRGAAVSLTASAASLERPRHVARDVQHDSLLDVVIIDPHRFGSTGDAESPHQEHRGEDAERSLVGDHRPLQAQGGRDDVSPPLRMLVVLCDASQPLGPMGAEWLQPQEQKLKGEER